MTPGEIERILKTVLPGHAAHLEMMPYVRTSAQEARNSLSPRESAVMLLLFPLNGRLSVLFTKRSEYKGAHSGQISLPGGKPDPGDAHLEETALRETEEEVGVARKDIQILGKLSEIYIPPSNFIAQPFVGWLDHTPVFMPHEREVNQILPVALEDLFHPSSRSQRPIYLPVYNITLDVPCYIMGEHVIWGATALIINEFRWLYESLANPTSSAQMSP